MKAARRRLKGYQKHPGRIRFDECGPGSFSTIEPELEDLLDSVFPDAFIAASPAGTGDGQRFQSSARHAKLV
jgi:hypothetical protein